MNPNTQLVEEAKVLNIIPAAEWNGGAVTGDYFSMKNASRVTFIVNLGALSAGATLQVTQATAAAGTGAKILVLDNPDDTQNFATAVKAGAGSAVKADRVDGDGKVTVAGTDDNGTILIDVRAEQLDRANDFDYLTITAADPGASFIAGVTAVVRSLRYSDPDGDISIIT